MKPFKLERWVRQIAATKEIEINCSECLDRIGAYVEAELVARTLDEPLDQVRQHLGQCQVCREEYEVLRDLVDMENHGLSPSIEDPDEPA